MSVSEFREYFEYQDGRLIWRKDPSKWHRRVGQYADTSKTNGGYRVVSLKNKTIGAHRVVFALLKGYLPDHIDHINGDRTDNRIENLRECTPSQNQANRKRGRNNTSGRVGVFWCNTEKKWVAQINFERKRKRIGTFARKEDAIDARQRAEESLFGEFKRRE